MQGVGGAPAPPHLGVFGIVASGQTSVSMSA